MLHYYSMNGIITVRFAKAGAYTSSSMVVAMLLLDKLYRKIFHGSGQGTGPLVQ